jgi:hypothetical protein
MSERVDDGQPASRFPPPHRALTPAELVGYDELTAAFAAVEKKSQLMKAGRYRALALTKLEESWMWAVNGLTSS